MEDKLGMSLRMLCFFSRSFATCPPPPWSRTRTGGHELFILCVPYGDIYICSKSGRIYNVAASSGGVWLFMCAGWSQFCIILSIIKYTDRLLFIYIKSVMTRYLARNRYISYQIAYLHLSHSLSYIAIATFCRAAKQTALPVHPLPLPALLLWYIQHCFNTVLCYVVLVVKVLMTMSLLYMRSLRHHYIILIKKYTGEGK
jgi:hypothetical protein